MLKFFRNFGNIWDSVGILKTVCNDIWSLLCYLLGCHLPLIYLPNYHALLWNCEEVGASIRLYIWMKALAQRIPFRVLNTQPITIGKIYSQQGLLLLKKKACGSPHRLEKAWNKVKFERITKAKPWIGQNSLFCYFDGTCAGRLLRIMTRYCQVTVAATKDWHTRYALDKFCQCLNSILAGKPKLGER